MRGFKAFQFRRRTLMLTLCLSVLAGVGAARTGQAMGSIWPCLLAPFMLAAWPKRSTSAMLLVMLFGLSLGWARGTIYMQKLAQYGPYEHRKITISARASEDALYGKSKQLTFKAGSIKLENGQKLAGVVQLSGFGANAVFQGDEVIATGKRFYRARRNS